MGSFEQSTRLALRRRRSADRTRNRRATSPARSASLCSQSFQAPFLKRGSAKFSRDRLQRNRHRRTSNLIFEAAERQNNITSTPIRTQAGHERQGRVFLSVFEFVPHTILPSSHPLPPRSAICLFVRTALGGPPGRQSSHACMVARWSLPHRGTDSMLAQGGTTVRSILCFPSNTGLVLLLLLLFLPFLFSLQQAYFLTRGFVAFSGRARVQAWDLALRTCDFFGPSCLWLQSCLDKKKTWPRG